ncbi:hypothetical protein lbkm_1941 [Lachnospiraceae bacterium KM106-2]|nr:hypothetical protein lbkm_1941 [Lachnospiraceae bacterium KM106-2]
MDRLYDGLRIKNEWNLFKKLEDQGIFYRIAGKISLIKNRNNKIIQFTFNS